MLLEVKNLYKTYHAGKVDFQALHGIGLCIDKGEFTAIHGPSGSGKTTLLNIIGCIDKPDSGEVLLDGTEIQNKSSEEQAFLRREYFGFVFQTYNLIPVLSVFENVELPLRLLNKWTEEEIREKVAEVLKKVGLAGLENRKPMELSGGQQQRVSIARALVKNPKVILADEPTANLDSATGEAIIDLMRGMNEKELVTFVFSTHDKLVLQHAKRLVGLKDGKIDNATAREV